MTEQTWTTEEMQAEFTVLGFGFGYCIVDRKSDGQRGSLDFRRDPDGIRRYFNFVEYTP